MSVLLCLIFVAAKFIKPFRRRFEIVASYFVQPSVVLARFQYTTGYGIAEDDVTEPISVLPTYCFPNKREAILMWETKMT